MNLSTRKFREEFSRIKPLIFERDGWQCMAKNERGHSPQLEVDHIIPRSLQGNNKIDNLITLCSNCHRFYTDMATLAKIEILRNILSVNYGYRYSDRFSGKTGDN